MKWRTIVSEVQMLHFPGKEVPGVHTTVTAPKPIDASLSLDMAWATFLAHTPGNATQAAGCETRDALPSYSPVFKYEDAEVRLRSKFCDTQLSVFIP